MRARIVATGTALLLAFAVPAAAQGWSARALGDGFAAGMTAGEEFAGLRFECTGPGEVRTIVSHNGAAFDRARDHTVILSVDGTATVLSMQAVPGGAAGDDFVRSDPISALLPLLDALARGATLEVSAPSGRYAVPLTGSGRALTALRERCEG